MKPLTQFEKMRANRARRIASAHAILRQEQLQQLMRSCLPPTVQASEPYFGHPLNNRRGQQ